jgi:hypothetical protein
LSQVARELFRVLAHGRWLHSGSLSELSSWTVPSVLELLTISGFRVAKARLVLKKNVIVGIREQFMKNWTMVSAIWCGGDEALVPNCPSWLFDEYLRVI